ncbi:MAG TPA: O-antigen ligase family protein [Nitrospiraceae bacterium]|nr:O-antigen ligase family protein [Nitrospiraceae bacterium]
MPSRPLPQPSQGAAFGSKGAAVGSKESKPSSAKIPFLLVMLALVVEFARPQDVLLGLRAIPFPSLIDALIALAVLTSGKWNVDQLQNRCWIGLLALMAVHVPFANNNFWAAMTLKDMTLLFAMYLGVLAFVDSTARIRVLLKVWLGVHFFLAIFGAMHKGAGVGGWLGDENDFCMEMNAAVPFAFFAFQSTTNKVEKPIYMGLLCTFILAGMVSLSRGGFIGLAVVGTYCWMRSSRKIAAVLLVGLAVVFMLLMAPQEYWEEVQSITSDQTMETGTGGERLYSWGIGWDMFLGNPILGVGQGNYPWNVEEYEAGRTFNTRSLAGRQAHSAYFTLLPELGLVGTGIFIAFVYGVYRDLKFVRRKGQVLLKRVKDDQARQDVLFISNLARAVEGSVVGYLASSVFISTLYYPTFWVLMAFTVAVRTIAGKVFDSLDAESQDIGPFGLRPIRPIPRRGPRATGTPGPVMP